MTYTRLEQLRIERNLTYESLAGQIGIAIGTLHLTIKGKTTPNARSAYKIDRWLKANDAEAGK